MRDPGRRTALAVALVGAVAFVALAWWLVPWDPVGHPVVPARAEDHFTPEQLARAESYSWWARWWSYGSLAVSLTVACWLGFTSAGARLVGRLPGPTAVVVVLAVVACGLIGRVATLPFAVALHRLRLDAGLSTQSWAGWARDVSVSELVTAVPTALGMLLVVVAARRWRRAWPAVVGVVLAGFVVLGAFVYPLVVEPLFNRFEPLPDGALRAEVLALADREGVSVEEVLVADASRRTTTLNAYVSGFGATKRVVLYDTLVRDAPAEETLSVVAHELAHARHDDPLIGIGLGVAGSLLAVGVLGTAVGTARAVDRRRVPLFLALVAVATVVSAPVQSGISRQVEWRADAEALAATGDPQGFVQLRRRLAVRSLADPAPPAWSQWVFGTHPTALERLGLVTTGSAVAGR